MSLPPPQTREFADRLTTLAIECRDELNHGSQAIQEIDLLIRQTQQEVDRLSQRENSQNSKLREVESSLESFSRTEIRDILNANHEIQMRLFMMRSQLEQLESRRDTIRHQQEKLRILLDLSEVNREIETHAEIEEGTRLLTGTVMLADGVDLATEIISAREEERGRVAERLANGPAQVMANVILRARILERVAEKAPEELPAEIANLLQMASDSLLDIRRSIFEMRPLMIDELGLVATLRRYCTDFSRENGATINVDGPESDDPIPSTSRVVLFRLIQQAMLALVKPNTGTKLSIQLRYEEAQLLIRMDSAAPDDAPPVDARKFTRDPYVRDLLELIGASVQTESFGSGHRVTFLLPITN